MLVRDFPNKRIKGLLERIKNGLGWRYQQFVEPTIDLYGDIPSFVKYQYQLKTKVLKHKAVYIYANRRNIGDYISHLGVREITGIQGGELYCSKGGHKEIIYLYLTFKISAFICHLKILISYLILFEVQI